MISFKKILVPTDFSSGSAKALEMAVEIARRFDSSVDVFHVVELPVYAAPEMTVAVPGTTALRFDDYARKQAGEEMESFLRSHGPGPDSPVRIMREIEYGEATRTILEYAKEGAYDLIVMGTHGRTGLDHMLLGSTAERVVRKAPCPVLTIREPRTKG